MPKINKTVFCTVNNLFMTTCNFARDIFCYCLNVIIEFLR